MEEINLPPSLDWQQQRFVFFVILELRPRQHQGLTPLRTRGILITTAKRRPKGPRRSYLFLCQSVSQSTRD